MTLFFFVLAGVLLVVLAGLAHLYYALRHAVSGYEDSRGFHGGDPDPEETPAASQHPQALDAQRILRPEARKSEPSLVRFGHHN